MKNLSTEIVNNPADNLRASCDTPVKTPLHGVVADQRSNDLPWIGLAVVAFLAGIATGILFIFSMTEPIL